MMYSSAIHTKRLVQPDSSDGVQSAMYYVTLCTQRRACLFGEIRQGKMKLNDAGTVVQKIWEELGSTYRGVTTDEFVIMPNHVHGIIAISAGKGTDTAGPHEKGAPAMVTLPGVVYHFKSYTTARYHFGAALLDWPPLSGRLWMKNHHEGVIRTEKELAAVRQFIRYNPLQWDRDRDNPANF